MPIRYYSADVNKSRKSKRKPPPTKPQLEALSKRMETVFQVGWTSGIKRMRASIDPEPLERAFRKGRYDHLVDELPGGGDLSKYFQEAMDTLSKTVSKTADMTRKDLPPSVNNDLRLDTKNKAISDYLNVRTGAMIQLVDEPKQVMVQQAVRGAFSQGMTPRDVADQIKGTIGLTEQQALQVQNFTGTKKDKAALVERLTDYRAMMVARTEISFATNQGQLAVWNASVDQGLIDPDATKVWIVDGAPCPKICDPMDGVEVPLNEPFELPDGVTISAPPAHPHCRCLMSLNIGDNPTAGRENYKDGADKADGQQDEEEEE